jgi:hypothetical protein
MRRWDITCTALLVLLGLYVVSTGWRLGFGAFESPGPGFIPVFAGVFLTIFSAISLALVMGRRRREPDRPFWPQPDSRQKLLATLAGPIAFTLLLNYAGFFLCTLAMLIFLFRVIHPHRLSLTLVLGLSTAFFCLVLFQFLLKVQFPEGIINFNHVKEWLF